MEKYNNIDEVLLTKYLLRETTEEEDKEVKQWIDSSTDNKKSFGTLKEVWEASLRADIPNLNLDVDRAWNRMNDAILETDTTKVIQFTPWKKIASSIAAILVLALGINFYTSEQQMEEVSSVDVYTVDMPQLETLKDGSQITLNAHTTLAVESFEGNTREVTLDGEAYFEIEPNEKKPFIVHTTNGDVTVLGTKFNVRTTEKDIVVTVTEGLVKLSTNDAGNKYVLLEKDTEGSIDANSLEPTKTSNLAMNNLFWKTKALSFHNEDLSNVINTLQNAYHVKINVRNEALNAKKLTVDFKENSIEEVFEVLQVTFNVQVQKTGEKAYAID